MRSRRTPCLVIAFLLLAGPHPRSRITLHSRPSASSVDSRPRVSLSASHDRSSIMRDSRLSVSQSHPIHRIPSVPDELLNRPLALRSGIGHAHDAVSTASKDAQAFHDQGLTYLHSFVWVEAARSFNQALRADGGLAMAHLGLTIAYTELNAPGRAQAALERAQALAKGAPAHDRAPVEARALQMAAEANAGDAARLVAYRAALERAISLYPKDAELLLLRGVAESPDPADRGQGAPVSAAPFFERALTAVPDHFGAHHYLAHTFENAGRSADALLHAAAFAKSAPAVPHALHMHGHVLRRVGRIDQAVAVFEEADRLERDYFRNEKVPAEHDWHYEHNLDLLASSYRYQGLMSKAEDVQKAAFAVPSSLVVQMVNKHAWPGFLTSRGRTADALAAAAVLVGHPAPLVRAAGYIETGHAQLAAGRFPAAAEAANAALKELKSAPDGAALVGPAFEALQGAFFVRTNQREKGRAMLQSVARRARQAPGPDAWVQALFTLESMARTGRDAGDWDTAAWAASEMAAHDPDYAGTHYALGLVAEHNGDRRAARTAFALAERYWAKADPGLPELVVIRKRR